MSDLDFKHNVQQIPQGEALQTLKRTESVQSPSGIPDIQGAVSDYAANTNWLSEVGSTVATRAANATAAKLGGQSGHNPQGDLYPAITNFDKTFNESYKAQAQSTLSLQANKLITDSNVAMAKAPRLTPDLIAKTNNQVSIGLQNIFSNAPAEIRPNLEAHYGAQQINQIGDLAERMNRENREDLKANTAYSSQVSSESAYSLAAKGNIKGAEAALKSVEQANDSLASLHIIDKVTAKSAKDVARQSKLSGEAVHGYELARAEEKGEQYLKEFSEQPESVDKQVVYSHLMQYINQQNNLKHQDAALAMAKFNVSLVEHPELISDAQIQEAKSHLDPIQQQELQLSYVKAIKAIQKSTAGIDTAMKSYTNVNDFPLLPEKDQNGAWHRNTNAILNRPESVATNMSEATAKLYSAAIAPIPIKAYTTELSAKGATANPVNLEEVGQAVNYMRSHNLGQNLIGLDPRADATQEIFGMLRQFNPPIEAAQMAHDKVYNKSESQSKANQDALAAWYKQQNGLLHLSGDYGLVSKLIGAAPGTIVRNLPGYTHNATKIFDGYFNYFDGDETMALKKTKEMMDTYYGESNANGKTEVTYMPIERIPGIPHDAIGPIQSDIVEQANQRFMQDKKNYDEGKSDFWYEARLRYSAEEAVTSKRILDAINEGKSKHPITQGVFDIKNQQKEYANHLAITEAFKNGQEITIIKHNRSGKDEHLQGSVEANPWGVATGRPAQPVSGGYELKIKTGLGSAPILLYNELSRTVSYNPRVQYIQKLYTHTVGLSTLQYRLQSPSIQAAKALVSESAKIKMGTISSGLNKVGSFIEGLPKE